MAANDRNDSSPMANGGQPQNGGQGNSNAPENTEENPQQGAQWDNYQTRTLSSEGEPEIAEGDLLNADEAQKQPVEHRSDSE